MENPDLIVKLKEQSTWRLLGLGIVTYGIYFAHYINKQTNKINGHLNTDKAISNGFIIAFFVMTYLSAALFIAYLVVDYGYPIEIIANVADSICGVMLIVWGFKARNRVNSLCSSNSESKYWFHGLWTFLFSPLYFNYKVNWLTASGSVLGGIERCET